MKPVLLTIGPQPISSFGVLLLFSLVLSIFVIWRITRVYDLDEEQVLDLVLATFFGGLVFARIYYVLFHLDQFDNVLKMILINRYPGLSFWGGLLGGFLSLRAISSYFKVNFWQVADFGVVGLFLGLSISAVGCLLASCQAGLESNFPLSVTQVGLVGKRFPLQIVEAGLFLVGFFYLKRLALKFHFTGAVASIGLIIFGAIKFILEPYRGDQQASFLASISLGSIWSVVYSVLGIRAYYSLSKRSFRQDLKLIFWLITDQNRRGLVAFKILKTWYNFKVNLKVSIQKRARFLLKVLNVKSNPSKF